MCLFRMQDMSLILSWLRMAICNLKSWHCKMAKKEHRKQWLEVAFKFQQFHLVVRLVLLCLVHKNTGLKKNHA